MEFKYQSGIPLGVEPETVALARKLREDYEEFWAWVHGGETPGYMLKDEEKASLEAELENILQPDEETFVKPAAVEPWLLSAKDIEYFYNLSRPADVGCACPYGWVEKVERIVDQQYAVFGVERFPDLYEKSAHIAWLLFKNEVFPDFNPGVAVLAILTLLGRNGRELRPSVEDLKKFVSILRFLIKTVQDKNRDEDPAIRVLGGIVRGWSH